MNTLPGNIILASQKAYTKYGLLSSVQLAQYILESAWGLKLSGKNNPFGIKAKVGTAKTTHEVFGGQSIITKAVFRDFDSIEQAFDLHANLLVNGKPYITCRPYLKDYHMYCIMMGRIYATDPEYSKKLINLIDTYKLNQYDKYYTDNKPVVVIIAATAGSSVALAAIKAPQVIHNFDYTPILTFSLGLFIGMLIIVLWAIYEHFKPKPKGNIQMILAQFQANIDAIKAFVATHTDNSAALDAANATIAQMKQDESDTNDAITAALVPPPVATPVVDPSTIDANGNPVV